MVDRSIAETVRVAAGAVVGARYRATGDLEEAEDAYVDAAFAAFDRWPRDGIPSDPRGWLLRAATRAADVADDPAPEPGRLAADELGLMVTCAHPALGHDEQAALLLRLCSGLTTRELASVFLSTEEEMAAKIDGVKATVRTMPLAPVEPAEPVGVDRLRHVLAIVHFVFSTGLHALGAQRLARVDLADEGTRLARRLTEILPDEPECLGLLALCTAVRARRGSPVDAGTDPGLLADADRAAWDRDAIAEAAAILDRARTLGPPGPYVLQAEIACLHSAARSTEATDWDRIAEWYRRLDALGASPFVAVNRALAEARAHGPDAGLAVLDAATDIDGWHVYHAARAELLEQAGRPADAATAVREALAREPNDADRRLLEARLRRLTSGRRRRGGSRDGGRGGSRSPR